MQCIPAMPLFGKPTSLQVKFLRAADFSGLFVCSNDATNNIAPNPDHDQRIKE